MAVPPFVEGGAHDTATLWFPGVTLGFPGAVGTPFGVTGVEAGDAVPVPFPLVAFTVKV